MPNYKEMYFKMFCACEKAMEILIQVQQECEELYITSAEPIVELRVNKDAKNSVEED